MGFLFSSEIEEEKRVRRAVSGFLSNLTSCFVQPHRRGFYGAFLMDDLPLVYKLVSELVKVRRRS